MSARNASIPLAYGRAIDARGRGGAPGRARSTISTSAAASRRATWATSPSSRRSWRSIREAVARHGLTCRLQCEPGRVLVADGASALARVELRRDDSLYLNDGVYGNLAELKWIGPQFPMRLVRAAARQRRRPHRLRPVRADLRQHRQHARPALAAGRHRRGRLGRGRHDGRLLQRAEDRLQRLRQREAGDPRRRRAGIWAGAGGRQRRRRSSGWRPEAGPRLLSRVAKAVSTAPAGARVRFAIPPGWVVGFGRAPASIRSG